MLARPACLASPDALTAASPAELATAVLFAGYSAQVDALERRVSVDELMVAIAQSMNLFAGIKPNSFKWFEALSSDPMTQLKLVVMEGIIFAEQRLCLWRDPHGASSTSLVLLRRGRAVLLGGDPGAYLG
ncbi:MAG TPA: hypothetical protein VGM78_07860 [Ilumatobacteraceae bacterium]